MFDLVPGATALIRKRPGVYSEVLVYTYGKRYYFKVSAGYIGILAKFGDTNATTHPDYTIIELKGLSV